MSQAGHEHVDASDDIRGVGEFFRGMADSVILARVEQHARRADMIICVSWLAPLGMTR